MICFRYLGIFGEKLQKTKKKPGHIGLLLRRVGCLVAARPRFLHRSIAELCRGVATVHSEQISDFCFRTPHICTPIV